MDKDLRKLEREIDAGLQSLGARLDGPGLGPAALERILAAVRAEADRAAPMRRAARRIATWSSFAAAAAIALVMAWPPVSSRPMRFESELYGNLSLSEWIVAAGESGDEITMLLEGEWSPEGAREMDGRHDSLDEALDSLEDSMTAMESVFGA